MKGKLSGAWTGGFQFGPAAAASAGLPWDRIKPFVRSGTSYQEDVDANRYIRSVRKGLPAGKRLAFDVEIDRLRRSGLPRPEIALIVEAAVAEALHGRSELDTSA